MRILRCQRIHTHKPAHPGGIVTHTIVVQAALLVFLLAIVPVALAPIAPEARLPKGRILLFVDQGAVCVQQYTG